MDRARTRLFDSQTFLADIQTGGLAAQEAARQWLRWFRPRLSWLFRRHGVAGQDLEDLLFDTLAQVLDHSEQLREPQAFVRWVDTTAARLCQAHCRRMHQERRLLLRDGDRAPPSDEADAPALDTVLEQADWSQSDPLVRWCVEQRLAAFEKAHPSLVDLIIETAFGGSGEDIAEALGREAGGTLRQAQSQALALLLDCLRQCFDDAVLTGLKRGHAKPRRATT